MTITKLLTEMKNEEVLPDKIILYNPTQKEIINLSKKIKKIAKKKFRFIKQGKNIVVGSSWGFTHDTLRTKSKMSKTQNEELGYVYIKNNKLKAQLQIMDLDTWEYETIDDLKKYFN